MAVTYSLAEKGNPSNPTAPKKIYATAKSRGELTFRQLAKEIAQNSTTVSDSDMLAVLNDLVKIMRRHLENGEIVRFGDFGAFRITLSSEGADTAAQFKPSMIKNQRINFTPGTELKEMLATLKFEKSK